MALLVPDWTERHVPDLGITLVELLAYVGDYLSYYQDAVATEAYLGTARQRISVRRHARLVDYRLHEGCNARAWVQLSVSENVELPRAQVAFVTARNAALGTQPSILGTDQLAMIPASAYEYFEPLSDDQTASIDLRQAHNDIPFYTWGNRECCLLRGSTRATLVDKWAPPAAAGTAAAGTAAAGAAAADTAAAGSADRPPRALAIAPGDVLIFEEMLGPRSGLPADADPKHRHAVRVTDVRAAEDPLYGVPLGEGAIRRRCRHRFSRSPGRMRTPCPSPSAYRRSASAPGCAYISDISVAHGNVILVDHGRTLDPEPLPPVPGVTLDGCCECEGQPSDVETRAGRYRPTLSRTG